MNKETTHDKKSTEETLNALHVSELRYRRLFETAKDGILILDAITGQIVDVNPFLVELLGYSHKQFVNKNIWDIGFFKDILSNRDNFEELKNKKYIRYEDLPLETADGRKIDVEFVSNVYQQDSHSVIQCNIRDITDRKRAADAIAAEKERLAVTLRSIGDGVIATDAQGNVEIMNNIAEELCGWKQNDAQGKPIINVFNSLNEMTRNPQENSVEKVLKTGEIIENANHSVIISKTGIERIIADSVAPIRDRKNNVIGVVLVFRDVTDKQKLLETAQRNQKLESLGLLAGGIAHDFNNLFGGIFGYINLANMESKDDRITGYLSKALNSLDRARGLTGQLLTFAKGGGPVRKITPLFPFMQETAQFALSGSTVACRFDIAPGLKSCNIDRNQIAQVINNIITNAQQSMPTGGTVEVTARNVSLGEKEHPTLAKGLYVMVSIKDPGCGIPKEILGSIFDPFFTTKTVGHGIGLATCYSIINRHGGCIEVESEPDKGSTFHIYLPASAESVSPSTLEAVTSLGGHTGSGTLIVMDDEELVRESIGSMLEYFGYSVVCTKNGKEACDCFYEETKANRAIAGMIFDLTVPGGMGGKEAIAEIRKSDAGAKVPVFVTSGYADDPIMANPGDYGFTASISKPFGMEELVKMLENNLKNKTC